MAFCDGFEVSIGEIDLATLFKSLSVLRESMQQACSEITIKNILPKRSRSGASLWVTLQPETASLTCETMAQLLKMVTAVRLHADLYWRKSNLLES